MAGSGSVATGLSRRRMSNVAVLWEPEVEGLKRETSRGGLPLMDEDEEEGGGGARSCACEAQHSKRPGTHAAHAEKKKKTDNFVVRA